ncbi:hypothetical protein C8Q78DRAFT_1074832 [Trametes maxima]|nr:hypothetical protein C8Q78DRAFT_1074832 [Trametes maxima]
MRCTVDFGDGGSSTGGSSHSGTSGSKSSLNPVVPALIAVTVFILACVVMTKAIRGLRGERVVPVYRTPGQDSEKKPRVWEVRLDNIHTSPRATPQRWHEVMPVGVEYVRPCASAPLARPPGAPNRLSPSITRDSRRSSRTVIPEKTAADEKASGQPESACLRVAVLIAMPTLGRDALAAPAPAYLGLAYA